MKENFKFIITVIIIICLVVTFPIKASNNSKPDEDLNGSNPRGDLDDDIIQRLHPYPTGNGLWDVAWKPNGEYAIIVGYSGIVFKFDGNKFEDLTTEADTFCTLASVAWKPDGSYALIAGYQTGSNSKIILLKFDGSIFTEITMPNRNSQLRSIAWKPDGSYALIIGTSETVFKYTEANGVADISPNIRPDSLLIDISWKYDGSCALIVGGGYNDGYYSTVLKFDGTTFTNISNLFNGNTYIYGVSWKPNGDYALVVANNNIVKYNGTEFIWIDNYRWAREVEWKPDGSYALIQYEDGVAKYDGSLVTDLSAPEELHDISSTSDGIGWKSDGSYCLLVGGSGLVVKYNGNAFNILSNYEVYWGSSIKVGWKPSGDYAILTDHYSVHTYDGSDFTEIIHDGGFKVVWHPDERYALIPCWQGKIMLVNESGIEVVSSEITERPLHGAAWHPNGSYALIVGGSVGGDGYIFKYDGETFTDLTDLITGYTLFDVFWEPNGEYAFIEGFWRLWKWDGVNITDVTDILGNDKYVTDFKWHPNSDYALVTGVYHEYINTISRIIWKYDGTNFIEIYNETATDTGFFWHTVDWHPCGGYAYILGTADINDDGYDETCRILRYNEVDGTFDSRIFKTGSKMTDFEWHVDGEYALIVGSGSAAFKYIPSNLPPKLTSNIPDTYALYEDDVDSGDDLIDLSDYFDDENGAEYLDYYVTYNENCSIVNCQIDGYYVDFVPVKKHWYGTLEFQVSAVDSTNYERVSNRFKVTVIPTDDPPVINDIKGIKPVNGLIEFGNLTEDQYFDAIINVTEYDNESVSYSTNFSNDNFNILKDSRRLIFLPSNSEVGVLFINLTVTDENKSKGYVDIKFVINNSNDEPDMPVINFPRASTKYKTTDQIMFSGSCEDIDLNTPNSGEELTFIWWSNISGRLGKGDHIERKLRDDGWHEITLQVIDKGGLYNNASVLIYIELDIMVPPYCQLLFPNDGQTIKTSSLNLTWKTNFTAPEMITYDVYFGKNPNSTELVAEKSNDLFYSVTDLANATTYYWTVVPYLNDMEGECTSGMRSFYVEFDDVPVVIKEDPKKKDDLAFVVVIAVIILILILIIVLVFLTIKKRKKEEDPKFKIAEAPPQKIAPQVQPHQFLQPIAGNRCPSCTHDLTVFPDGSCACQNCGFKRI